MIVDSEVGKIDQVNLRDQTVLAIVIPKVIEVVDSISQIGVLPVVEEPSAGNNSHHLIKDTRDVNEINRRSHHVIEIRSNVDPIPPVTYLVVENPEVDGHVTFITCPQTSDHLTVLETASDRVSQQILVTTGKVRLDFVPFS